MSGVNKNSARFDWEKGFTVDFDLTTGISQSEAETSVRNVSDMRGMFADDAATEAVIADGNPMVYEFYEMGAPEKGYEPLLDAPGSYVYQT